MCGQGWRGWGAHIGTRCLCPALLGVNLWPEEPTARFLLCPDWAFCEFLPRLASKEPRTVLLDELWEGREYGLVVTAQPGEYRCLVLAGCSWGLPQPRVPNSPSHSPCPCRCCTGEVLRVAGFHKQCPVVEPVRR